MEFDYVFVFEFRKEHDFAVGALCIGGMLESVEYFFKSKYLSGFFVWDFPDMPIGSTSNFFEELVFGEDVVFDLISHNVLENIIFEF